MAGNSGSSSGDGRASILLVSKTGNGKSSLANALLNTSEFQVGRGMLSSTAHCKCISTHARGRDLTVVDTPGTMDVADEEKAKTEIRRAISFCPDGFDVFLLVVKCDARFTAEERRAIEVVAEMFGEEFYRHAIVVFSHGDAYDNDEAEFRRDLQKIRREVPYMEQLLSRCSNRLALVDNGRRCDSDVQDRQVGALLALADSLVGCNGGRKYSSSQLEAERKRAAEAEAAAAAAAAERSRQETLEMERSVRAQVTAEMPQVQQQDTSTTRNTVVAVLKAGAEVLLPHVAKAVVESFASRSSAAPKSSKSASSQSMDNSPESQTTRTVPQQLQQPCADGLAISAESPATGGSSMPSVFTSGSAAASRHPFRPNPSGAFDPLKCSIAQMRDKWLNPTKAQFH